MPALKPGESHLVAEALVRLRDAFDARRSKAFCWHSLSDVSKGGAGLSAFAGQIGLNIETVDFSAARMPKPPPSVASVECQTDLAQQRSAKQAAKKLAEGPLPRKKSRLAAKLSATPADNLSRPNLGLNQGYGWYRASENGRITTPRNLLPAAVANTGWRPQVPTL